MGKDSFIREKIILPMGDYFLGTSFMPTLRSWRKIQYLDKHEIHSIQNVELTRLLEHATLHIPFYRDLGIKKVSDALMWLDSFPIMEKADIKSNIESLVLWNDKPLVSEKSSGSSGIQGEVFMSRDEHLKVIAHQTFLWEFSGYRLGNPMLQLGITPNRFGIKGLKDILLRTDYQPAFDIDKQRIHSVLSKYKNKTPYFGGYASGLYVYASLAEEMGIQNLNLPAVISWGDKMFPHYRSKIEEVFNTRVYDTYGSTEGMVIAGQCEYGSYHILSPHVLLELLDSNGKAVKPGEIGRVVVTRLDSYHMPLIRYSLGDLAISEDPHKDCACGRAFPMLKKIVGRDTDIIRTSSGKQLIVHFFTGLFEHISAIRQFCVIQNKLDEIEIEYIPDPVEFSQEVLVYIKDQIESKLSEKLDIVFREVSSIPDTPSGKPQIIISTLVKS